MESGIQMLTTTPNAMMTLLELLRICEGVIADVVSQLH